MARGSQTQGHDARRQLAGIALLVAAVSSFSVLDSIGKFLSQTYPVMLIVWARYVFHVLVLLVLLGPRMGRRLVETRHPRFQVVRSLLLCLSTIVFFTGLSLMPLAEASSITQLGPVIATVLAIVWLKETPPRGVWVALAVSFVGVLLIIRPGSAVFTWAALLPLAAAFLFAGYNLLTRRLANEDDSLATLFIGGLVSAVVMTAVVPFFFRWPDSPLDAALFVALGLVGAFGHLLLGRAFERAPVTVLAPFTYLQVVAALTLGWLVFGQFPDTLALLGMGLIVATGMINATARRG